LARVRYPLNLPQGPTSTAKHILDVDNSWTPGKQKDAYMEPVYDELIKAWNEGVWTYDQATKKNFRMYVWYQYSMHDFLAYGIFSGWCVHGKFPCPVCKTAL
jgi:hypothetical protein